MRVKLGWVDDLAAEYFAVIVFLCDGIFKIRRSVAKYLPNRARFFRIIKELPMELQMVLCYRLVESMRMNIPREQREGAFKQLARQVFSCK